MSDDGDVPRMAMPEEDRDRFGAARKGASSGSRALRFRRLLWFGGSAIAGIILYMGYQSDLEKQRQVSGPPEVVVQRPVASERLPRADEFRPRELALKEKNLSAPQDLSLERGQTTPVSSSPVPAQPLALSAPATGQDATNPGAGLKTQEADPLARRRAPIMVGGGQSEQVVRSAPGPGASGLAGQGTGQEAPRSGLTAGSRMQDESTRLILDHNLAFRDRVSSGAAKTVRASPPADLTYWILEGKLVSGVLETAIDSSLPGGVRAMVDEDVYGEHGRVVLIPKMTRLIGEYNSVVQNGQTRVLVAWRRAIRPDGSSVDLGSYATDSLGRGGLTGKVDNHFLQRFGTALMLSVVGGFSVEARGQSKQQGQNNIAADVYRMDAAKALQSQTEAILNRDLLIPPTIRVDQGARIKVFVAKDMEFAKSG